MKWILLSRGAHWAAAPWHENNKEYEPYDPYGIATKRCEFHIGVKYEYDMACKTVDKYNEVSARIIKKGPLVELRNGKPVY